MMLSKRVSGLGIIAGLLLSIQSAHAQGVPPSGLFQIVSGRFITCCGIAGPFVQPLPDAANAFIELTVDLQNGRAQMKFLGQDMQTVLRIPPAPCRSDFSYYFTNGTVFPDHIRFGEVLLPSGSDQASFSFVVSNSVDTLSVNGTVIAPCPGSADLPEEFQHTNVVAIMMPTASIRVSEVEVCWNSASNRTYQVQYRSNLETNEWVNLGSPVAGTGLLKCIPDKVPPGEPQRYYRVLWLP